MLKPYVCIACEKVILSQPDGVPSLISLFSKILVTVPEEVVEIPKNSVAPKEWVIYAAWDPEPGDEDKSYMFCSQILYPDQSEFGEVRKIKINVERGKRSQLTLQILGFPIGQTGVYTVRAWVEERGEQILGPIEFNIELEIVRQKQATQAH